MSNNTHWNSEQRDALSEMYSDYECGDLESLTLALAPREAFTFTSFGTGDVSEEAKILALEEEYLILVGLYIPTTV